MNFRNLIISDSGSDPYLVTLGYIMGSDPVKVLLYFHVMQINLKIIILIILGTTFLTTNANAQTICTSCDSTLLVTGTGEVKAKPDKATITIEVSTRGKTANEAVSSNATLAQKLLNTLVKSGIAEKDIQTLNVNVFPVYKDKPNFQPVDSVIIGYEATNSLIATVRKINDVGNTIDLIVSIGDYTIQGIAFALENDKSPKGEALKDAVADALEKAQIVTESAGTAIKGIKKISVDNNFVSSGLLAATSKDSTPILPGDLTVSASVSIEYIIDK